jgi:hypothetical protein
MGLRPVLGDVALPLTARAAGTFVSGPVAPSGAAGDVVLLVHCAAASGTTPTLDVSLEESADGSSWSAVTGSAVTQITAAGNRVGYATASKAFVRVTSAVGGTTPSVTFKATLLIL